MDKFNRVLKVLQKYQFWVVCGTVVLVAIICWWWASRGLAGQFQQRKAKLEEKFKGVVIPPGHPNKEVIDNIGKQRKSLQDNVLKAWETLYKEQKEKNPFPQELGENFKEEFEKLKPKEELRDKYREDYQNFILRHFPSLLKLVDVRRSADEQEPVVPGEARPGGPRAAPMRMDGRTGIEGPAARDRRTARNFEMAPGGPGGRMPGVAVRREGTAEDDKIGIVDWNASDITALESRFNWKDTPSTLAVVLAQEDLWVIEALLRVIANTNEGTTYATAAVKQIHTLQIGKDAVGGRQGEEGMFRAGPAGPGRPGMEGPTGPGPGAGSEDQRLVENRYVDEKGKPLQSIPDAAEFKMMPIRMNLVMDQRRLPKLLVECANSNMPIEVKRVRIHKTEGNMLSFGTSGAATGESRGGGFRGPTGPQGFEGSDRAVSIATDKQDSGTFDVPVEIYGVIYIYNPPNREKLGAGIASAGEAASASPAAPAAPPAAPPAGRLEP